MFFIIPEVAQDMTPEQEKRFNKFSKYFIIFSLIFIISYGIYDMVRVEKEKAECEYLYNTEIRFRNNFT